MGYLLSHGIQGDVEVIRYTCSYSENTIVKIILLHDFFSTKLFIAISCDSRHKGDLLEFWNLKFEKKKWKKIKI